MDNQSSWLAVDPDPPPGADAELLRAALDEGERDAILLALEMEAEELIMDDMGGRREAQKRNLHFIGTLGVLRKMRSSAFAVRISI